MPRYKLIQDDFGYGLVNELTSQSVVRIDFCSAALNHRRLYGGKKESLLKAVKAAPGLTVWDCTAGFGVDSFLMAAAGCNVTLFERSTTLAFLLEEALKQAGLVTDVASIVSRMSLVQSDARDHLQQALATSDLPDVIFIDPMFPSRKKSAQVKGQMQLLQGFIGKDEDVASLFRDAMKLGIKRVVVKRPTSVEALAKADYSLAAKANRFDVYLNH